MSARTWVSDAGLNLPGCGTTQPAAIAGVLRVREALVFQT